MSTRGGTQRMRVVPAERQQPLPVALMAIAPMAGEWDDDDDVIDFQDDAQDDTVSVAADALQVQVQAQAEQGPQESQAMTEGDSGAPRAPAGAGAGGGAAVAASRRGDEPPADLSVMIRVSHTGAVVTNKGGTEEQAGLVAYAHRLIDLVGDLLGLERFHAAECVFKPGAPAQPAERCLLFTESNGDAVLLRPRTEADLQALRSSLGL